MREQVAKAREITIAQRTARLGLGFHLDDLHAPDEWDRGVGIIDFEHRRYQVSNGIEVIADDHTLFTPRPDGRGWERAPAAGPGAAGPFWVLDLLAGVQSAERSVLPDARDPSVTVFQCLADLVDADSRTEHGVAVPGGYVLRELRAIPATVVIDRQGRIIESLCQLGHWRMEVRLSDFDQPKPINLPQGGED